MVYTHKSGAPYCSFSGSMKVREKREDEKGWKNIALPGECRVGLGWALDGAD